MTWTLKSGRRMPFSVEQCVNIAEHAIQKSYDHETVYPLYGMKASKEPCTPEERREVIEGVIAAWTAKLKGDQ